VGLKEISLAVILDGMGGLPTHPELDAPKKRSNPQMREKPIF